MITKSIFDNPAVGDWIIAGQRYRQVTAVKTHAAGNHPDSPIKNDLPAIEYQTAGGSRWRGLTN